MQCSNMTFELFQTKQHQTIPSTKGRSKSRQPTDSTAIELAQHGSEHDEDGEEAELEPGLAKALDLMTTKRMLAIDDKLNPLAKTVLSHAMELKGANDHLDEAEARVLQLETATEQKANRKVVLERKVESYRRYRKQRAVEKYPHIQPSREHGGGKHGHGC